MGPYTPQQKGARRSQRVQGINNQRDQGTNAPNAQDLLNKRDEIQQDNQWLEGEIKRQRDVICAYKFVIEDKSSECRTLKKEVEVLKQQIASVNQGSGWPKTGNILSSKSRGRDAQPDDDELGKLRTRFARQKDFISSLQGEILKLQQQTKQQAQRMQTQITGLIQELDEAKKKTWVKAPKVSDTEIQGKWTTIGGLIRQFVLKYIRGPLDPSSTQELAQLEQFHWLPDIMRMLRSPILRPVALESWIWHFLCFRIFDSQSSVWAGKLGVAFSTSCEQIRALLSRDPSSPDRPSVSIEQFHDWRVRSAHFISQFSTTDDGDNTIDVTATVMLDTLALVTSPTLSQGQVHDMKHDAVSIVQKAAELDKTFGLSKADFHVFITRVKLPLVQPPSFGFRFDPETMERVTAVPVFDTANVTEPTVDLAVSPGIFKSGNAEGANYGSERVLVKLQALCNLQSILDLLSGDEPVQETSAKQDMGVKVEPHCVKMEEGDDEDEVAFIKTEPGTACMDWKS